MSGKNEFWDKVFERYDEKYADEAAEKLYRHLPEQHELTEIIVDKSQPKPRLWKTVVGIAAAAVLTLAGVSFVSWISGSSEISVASYNVFEEYDRVEIVRNGVTFSGGITAESSEADRKNISTVVEKLKALSDNGKFEAEKPVAESRHQKNERYEIILSDDGKQSRRFEVRSYIGSNENADNTTDWVIDNRLYDSAFEDMFVSLNEADFIELKKLFDEFLSVDYFSVYDEISFTDESGIYYNIYDKNSDEAIKKKVIRAVEKVEAVWRNSLTEEYAEPLIASNNYEHKEYVIMLSRVPDENTPDGIAYSYIRYLYFWEETEGDETRYYLTDSLNYPHYASCQISESAFLEIMDLFSAVMWGDGNYDKVNVVSFGYDILGLTETSMVGRSADKIIDIFNKTVAEKKAFDMGVDINSLQKSSHLQLNFIREYEVVKSAEVYSVSVRTSPDTFEMQYICNYNDDYYSMTVEQFTELTEVIASYLQFETVEHSKDYLMGNISFSEAKLTDSQYVLNPDYGENDYYETAEGAVEDFIAITGAEGINRIGGNFLKNYSVDLSSSYKKSQGGTMPLPENITMLFTYNNGEGYGKLMVSASTDKGYLRQLEIGGKYAVLVDESTVSRLETPDGGYVDVVIGGIRYKGDEVEKGNYLFAEWTDKNGMNYLVSSSCVALSGFINSVAAIIGNVDSPDEIISYMSELETRKDNGEFAPSNIAEFFNRNLYGKWQEKATGEILDFRCTDEENFPISYDKNKLLDSYSGNLGNYLVTENGLWFMSKDDMDKFEDYYHSPETADIPPRLYYYDIDISKGETVKANDYDKAYALVDYYGSKMPMITVGKLGYFGVLNLNYSIYSYDNPVDIYEISFEYNGLMYRVNTERLSEYPIICSNDGNPIVLHLPMSVAEEQYTHNLTDDEQIHLPMMNYEEVTYITAQFDYVNEDNPDEAPRYVMSDKHYGYDVSVLDYNIYSTELTKQYEELAKESVYFPFVLYAEFLPIGETAPEEAHVVRTPYITGGQWAGYREIYYYPADDSGYEYITTVGCQMGTFRHVMENNILYALDFRYSDNHEPPEVSLFVIDKGRLTVYPIDSEEQGDSYVDLQVQDGVATVKFTGWNENDRDVNYIIDLNDPNPQYITEVLIPEPFPDKAYDADTLSNYFLMVTPQFGTIAGEFIDIVGGENFDRWIKSFENDDIATDIEDCTNIYSFLTDSNVEELDAERTREILKDNADIYHFTDEDIDVILSGDKNAVSERFVNSLAIYHDGHIYTPQWFYKNDISEYEKHNFDKQLVAEKMADAIDSLPFTAEGEEFLADKILEYTGVDILIKDMDKLMAEIEEVMPEPLKINCDEESRRNFTSKYSPSYTNIFPELKSCVSDEDYKGFEEYCDKVGVEKTVFHFVKFFDIKKDKLTEIVRTAEGDPYCPIISEADIGLFYPLSKDTIDKVCASDYAFVTEEEVYSAEYIYNADFKTCYLTLGMTYDELAAYYDNLKVLPLTDEAKKALAKKLRAYKSYYYRQQYTS